MKTKIGKSFGFPVYLMMLVEDVEHMGHITANVKGSIYI